MMHKNRILAWVAWSAIAVLALGPDALAQRRGQVGRSSASRSSVGRTSSAGRSSGSAARSIGQRSSSSSVRGSSSVGRSSSIGRSSSAGRSSSYGRSSSGSIGRSSIGRSSTSSSRVSPRSWSGSASTGTDSTGSSGRSSYGYPGSTGSTGSSSPRFLGTGSGRSSTDFVDSSSRGTRDVTPSLGEGRGPGSQRTEPGGVPADTGSSARGGEVVVDPLILDLSEAGATPRVRVPRLSGTSGRPAPARARAAALEHRREAAVRDGMTRTISDRSVSNGDILKRYPGATSRTSGAETGNLAGGRTALADVPRLSHARGTAGLRGAGAAARGGDENSGQSDAERIARIRDNQAARANADSDPSAARVKNIRENQALRKVDGNGSSADRISNIRRNQAIRGASDDAAGGPSDGGRDLGTRDTRTAGDPRRSGDRDRDGGGRGNWDRDDDGHCGYDDYDCNDHFRSCGWIYWNCGYSWYTWWYYPAWCGYRYYWWPVYVRPYYYDTYYEPVVYYADPPVVYVVDGDAGGAAYIDEPSDELVSGEGVFTGPVAPDLAAELSRAADYYLELGDRAFQERRYGDAVHHYAKAVEFNPDEGILYLVLSDALFATGDYHYAAYALRKAFDVDPTIAANVVDKHTFYSDPTEFDRQLAVLELYLEEHFLDDDARLVLAANYLYGGRPSEAVDLLQSAFSLEVSKTQAGRLILAAAEGTQYGQQR